jgi:hypothetical protein
MTRSTALFTARAERRLLRSVFALSEDGAAWRFRLDPPIGVRSLRSGEVYHHADGSVTAFEPRLQAWIMRPTRPQAYYRRIRAPSAVEADQAPSSTIDEAFVSI